MDLRLQAIQVVCPLWSASGFHLAAPPTTATAGGQWWVVVVSSGEQWWVVVVSHCQLVVGADPSSRNIQESSAPTCQPDTSFQGLITSLSVANAWGPKLQQPRGDDQPPGAVPKDQNVFDRDHMQPAKGKRCRKRRHKYPQALIRNHLHLTMFVAHICNVRS